MNHEGYYQEYVPTFREKLARVFGFRPASSVEDWEREGFVESGITTVTTAHFDFLDRLRILARGKVVIEGRTKTSCIVDRAETRTTVGVPW